MDEASDGAGEGQEWGEKDENKGCVESSRSSDGKKGDDRLLEAVLEPGSLGPVERGRWRWRRRSALVKLFRNGDGGFEEATVVMVWDGVVRGKRVEGKREGEGNRGGRED